MTGVLQIPKFMGGDAPGSQSSEASLIATGNFSASPVQVVTTPTGTHVLKGLRIFKQGTFKDSMGVERTWEAVHLQQMITNYHLLKDGGFLPNVPVRVDHSLSVQNVAGYFADVYLDPTDTTFLAADVEITEPDAYAKWQRGTYRSRSLEVGMYETNDGALYWPVIVGLAFVDLPAVEGLHSAGGRQSAYFTQALQDDDKEKNPMFTFNGQQFASKEACEAAIRYAQWVEAAEYAQSLVDFEAACSYASALEAHNANAIALGVQGLTVVQAQNNHGAAPQAMLFSVNGATTSDPGVIQSHISTLESFRSETTKANRQRFVDELARTNKIGAQQLDNFKAHVETLTDEGFTSFTKMWENAPVHPLLQPHGDGGGGGGDGGGSTQTLQEKFEIERQTVDQLKRSGMDDETVKKTSAYQRMTTLQAQLSGSTA